MTAPSLPLSRTLVAVLALLVAALWFGGLGMRKLIHPDEGRYAEIAREMAVTGDWVTPRLNGLKYLEKPPLQYWMTALAYRTLGVAEWTARLWPALTAYAAVLVVGYAGHRVGGRAVGLYSALALAGMVGWAINAHVLSLDAGLAAFLATALAALLIAQRSTAAPAACRNWMLVAWAAMALATLSKGLIGVVLPGGALVVYTLLQRDFALWRRLYIGRGLLLFLAIATPWFVQVARANDEFLQFFFIHEHFRRFAEPGHARPGSWWYFVPLLLGGSLPWLPVLAAGARQLVVDTPPGPNGFSWQRFALAWAAFVFVFFSASSSKLPSYILPLFPALALLTGWLLARFAPRTLARLCFPLTVAALVALAATPFVDEALLQRFVEPGSESLAPLVAFVPWLAGAMAICVAGGGLAWVALRSPQPGGRTIGIAAVALTALCAVRAGEFGYDNFRVTRSAYDLLQRADRSAGGLRRDVPFYQVLMYEQTTPFYLNRTTTLVEFRDELALGIAAEPDRAYARLADWLPVWRALDAGYALMSDGDHAALAAQGVPMRELARDPRRVLVSRR
jgi:4-amino-4-deoxy-L-arabinose transferase-like glycosyltransferase